MKLGLACILIALATAGCGNKAATCTEGASVACACPNGGTGAQVCASGAYGACTCSGAAAAAPAAPTPAAAAAAPSPETAAAAATAQSERAAKEALEAQQQVEHLAHDADELSHRLDAAVEGLAKASNDAERKAATEALAQVRKDKADLDARIAAARETALRLEREAGVHVRKECLENPLAKGC